MSSQPVNSMHRRASIPKQQGDVVLKVHVAKMFHIFRGMLQVFYMDVAKVDRDVAYAATVSEACCKHLFKVIHLFQTYVASILIWILHMVHTFVARVCSKSFSYFILILH
jgi:hypothetical protein